MRNCNDPATIYDARRSTRVRLQVVIEARGLSEPLTCEGQTLTVNLHGALILSAVPLRVAMEIEFRVISTNMSATATVVYIDPDQPRHCAISLHVPKNIWGVAFPPDDWGNLRA